MVITSMSMEDVGVPGGGAARPGAKVKISTKKGSWVKVKESRDNWREYFPGASKIGTGQL